MRLKSYNYEKKSWEKVIIMIEGLNYDMKSSNREIQSHNYEIRSHRFEKESLNYEIKKLSQS